MTQATTTVKFTAKLLATASSNLVNASNAIDVANNAAANPTARWAMLAAAGVTSNSITKEEVGKALAKAAGVDVPSNLPAASRSRWFAFSKVEKNNGLDRLLAGEALHEVARSYKATQVQKGKGGKGGGKGKDIASKAELTTFNDAAAALLHWINTATANTDAAMRLAKSTKLAELLAAIGKLEKVATVGATKAKAATAKAAAQAKADKAANAKLARSKAKAKNVVVPAMPKGRAKVTTKLALAA